MNHINVYIGIVVLIFSFVFVFLNFHISRTQLGRSTINFHANLNNYCVFQPYLKRLKSHIKMQSRVGERQRGEKGERLRIRFVLEFRNDLFCRGLYRFKFSPNSHSTSSDGGVPLFTKMYEKPEPMKTKSTKCYENLIVSQKRKFTKLYANIGRNEKKEIIKTRQCWYLN